jgi:hypothetical protein
MSRTTAASAGSTTPALLVFPFLNFREVGHETLTHD